MHSVTIRVPATTTNLGPGFDTLGIALQLYNYVTVRRLSGPSIIVRSAQMGTASVGANEMIAEAARAFFRRARRSKFGFEAELHGDVPVARGLGSSVTVRLGIVAALNVLARAKWNREQLLELLAQLEHHPDNAAPALFGGFTVAGLRGSGVSCLQFPVSERLRFVALIPDFEVSTEKARRLVPKRFSKADTVHNLNRAAFISAAFASADYKALGGSFDDRVHQPYREKLIPQLTRVIRAGEKAGAIGGWLSGSGSTIVCLTQRRPAAVARAMQRVLPNSKMKLLLADNTGFTQTAAS